METISKGAFSGCGISDLDLSVIKSLHTVKIQAFLDCKKLERLVLPEQSVTFASGAFQGCISLEEVNIPDTYTEIGVKMFQGCTSLKKVTLGLNVKTIGNGAFFECTALKDVVWNENITRIDWSAFYSCSSLESLVLPDKLEYIDDYAFQDCIGLVDISLGSNVSYIGTECFSGLINLKAVDIDAVEPPMLGSFVFNITPVNQCMLTVPEESIEKYRMADQWKDFMISTTYIENVSGVKEFSFEVYHGILYLNNLIVGDIVSIYSLAGHNISNVRTSTSTLSICIPPGSYIISVNNTSIKIIVP